MLSNLPSYIYVAVLEDRHTEVEVCVFISSEERSVAHAKARCNTAGVVEELESDSSKRMDGWLYDAVYSWNGDSIRVVRRALPKGWGIGVAKP